MKSGRVAWTIVVLLVIGALGVGIWRTLHRRGAPEEEAKAEPVATVQVAPLRQERIDETLTALGVVEPAPGATETVSVPFECRVRRVLVVNGQSVEADTPLAEIEPSPDAALQLEQARQDRDAAKNQLALMQQKLDLKLTTKLDLQQAQQALATAELKLRSLEKRGVGDPRTLRAADSGIVSRVAAQQGQIIAAGASLVETVGANRIVIRFGVEAEDAVRLRPAQEVHMEPVNGPNVPFEGKLQSIGREVSPETRLVSLYVAPAPGADVLLNEYVRGRIVVASKEGLAAPPPAVLPEGEVYVLYTVEKGRAVRHEVKVGLQNERQAEVVGSDLKAGDAVVIVGNSQLENSMAVEVMEQAK